MLPAFVRKLRVNGEGVYSGIWNGGRRGCTFSLPSAAGFYLIAESVVDDAKCILVTRVRVCACLFLVAFPRYCTDPDVAWGMVEGAL